ncbi:MAG: hypothetical protein ABR515_07220 [Nitrososphaeraceae archaeon]
MIIDSMIDMVLGMGLGMVASPLMMKAIKSLKQKRRINRILDEISELQRPR